jgi:pyruvate,water dikinase
MIKGVCGFGAGTLIGEVMIVNDFKTDYFESGKILVTPKTTVDSIAYMKKASAVITNHGGRTSHAMIVCRDNRIFCIIGTFDATKQLCTGDKIKMDFDNLTIKILKKKR